MMMDPTSMPSFGAIYNAFKTGQHLSYDNENSKLWHAYRQRKEEWTVLLKEMGHELREEQDRYCYLAGEGQNNAATAEIAVFMLVLIRHIARTGEDVSAKLMESTWTMASLPHLEEERAREIMSMVKITNAAQIEATVRKMAKLGFVKMAANGGLTFCSPVRRFLTMCIEAYEAEERGDEPPVATETDQDDSCVPDEEEKE